MITTYNNFDIVDLAIKQKLIGVEIQDKSGVWKQIENYYLDFATQEINVIFIGETQAEVFSFKQKFTVRITDYKSINKLKRNFKKMF